MPFTFELQDDVDEVFEHPGPGDGAVFGHVTDQYGCDAAFFRDRDQGGRDLTHLRDTTCRPVEVGNGHGLHGIDDQQRGIDVVEVFQDGADVGFGREEEVRRGIAEVLGEEAGDGAPWRIDFTERIEGNRSPMQSQLMETIGAWVKEHDAGADVVPVILPGFTDSRHFRVAFPECVAYGFFPQRHQTLFETQPLIHAADERIDVRDLAFATEFFRDLALRVLDPRSA